MTMAFPAIPLGLLPISPRFAAHCPAPETKETDMLITIKLAGTVTAQGLKVAELNDGRVTIETGRERLTGWPVPRVMRGN